MMPQKTGKKFVGGQNTDISISADRDYGEMKKTETPSKSRRAGRYGQIWWKRSTHTIVYKTQGEKKTID